MQQTQLTKEIIDSDLKREKCFYVIDIVLVVALAYFIICELIEDINKDIIPLIILTGIGLLLILCFILNLVKKIIIRNKYSIGEGTIKTSLYYQNRKKSRSTIIGFKGVIISPNNFSIGQDVFVIYNGKNALMCYGKDKYYL